ncbi:MAG: MBL fold metallo-hydrolase [Bifidobacteriaceae bacterium]|jgi:ribonuclease BN (tRNA processing enzyme)|nr:MBL fold metallo-hydrolase [Bifidobacteriaceae bacterium]
MPLTVNQAMSTKPSLTLTVVGCCGCFAGPDSPASSYLISLNTPGQRPWKVVLDLGSGAFGALQALLDPAAIDAIAISHHHADHAADLAGLKVYARHNPQGALPPIRLFAPAKVFAKQADQTAFNLTPWQDNQPVTLGPLTLLPRRVQHPVEAYGIGISFTPDQPADLVYTGDTDLCPAIVELAGGARVLLADATFREGVDLVRGIHLTGRRAGLLAAEAGVGQLILTHLPVWHDPAAIIAEAAAVFAGPITLAKPGLSLVIPSVDS